MASYKILFTLLSLASTIFAKTDLTGCTTSNIVTNGGASVLWYVADTGEICAPLDCGGGRAPPKTTVPGCAAYSGTASYSPSFIPGYAASATPASITPASTTPASKTAVSAGLSSAYHAGPSTTPSQIPLVTDATNASSAAGVTVAPAATSLGLSLASGTSTLNAATGTADTSLVTSAIIFDTSAVSKPPLTNMVTTASVVTASRSPAQATGAAVARSGMSWAAGALGFGAVAGLALI